MALIRLVIAGVTLLFMSGCNLIGGDGKTESGISGDGVIAGKEQAKVGDGSNTSWNSASCRIVTRQNIWRKSGSTYGFSIGGEGSWVAKTTIDIRLTQLPSCIINSVTKVAYTTKDWLCTGDYVKVDGEDCLIEEMSGQEDAGITGDGVTAGRKQRNIGNGSASSWSSTTCSLVEGNEKWQQTSKYAFDVLEVDPNEPNDIVRIEVLELSSCTINSRTKIAYTTKNWLCKGEYVRIDGVSCEITAITSL